jgi:hypothetical protein
MQSALTIVLTGGMSAGLRALSDSAERFPM